MKNSKPFTRRRFVKSVAGTLGIVGIGGLPVLHANQGNDRTAVTQESLPLRDVGDTGLKFTPLGYGAMRTSDPAVIRRALEMGINNIDTARGYMHGRNERIVAEAVRGMRDRVHITTKIRRTSYDQMRNDIDESLQALDTDYIDILLLHGVRNPSDLQTDHYKKVLTEAKEAGKVRFVGFSTHSNMANLLTAAAEDGFYDVVLAAYNFKHGEEMTAAIRNAAEAGIGVIAMKTQAGGYDVENTNLNPHQAALKWVLSNEGVSSAIPSMVTFDQLEQNYQVMSTKFGWMDRKTLYKYGESIDDKLCRFCEECVPSCPYGVRISDVNRCVMYADGYGDLELARSSYAELETVANASICSTCDVCTVKCSKGVNVAANMRRAMELFT